METSSEISDTMSIANTDDSFDGTFDEYVTAFLEEQNGKENMDPESDVVPFGCSDILYCADNNYHKDDWVVAKFATKKSLKHYVGRILSVTNNIPTVKFLRKVKNSKNSKGLVFTYPDIDDVCEMHHPDDILLILPKPNISRRGQLIFNINLCDYNIQ